MRENDTPPFLFDCLTWFLGFMDTSKRFVVGLSYACSNPDWTIRVLDRTDTTLTFDFLGMRQTREIRHYADGLEYVRDGEYQYAVSWSAHDSI